MSLHGRSFINRLHTYASMVGMAPPGLALYRASAWPACQLNPLGFAA
jgi:hypothetical protein